MDDKSKTLVICGVNAVAEKLKSAPEEILELMIAAGRRSPRLEAIAADARRRGVPVHNVDWQKLTALADGTIHQGIAAAVATPAYADFNRLGETLKAEPRRLLVLDGVTDPRNFGALLRSAEGAGISDVIIAKDRAVGVTPAVIKSSAGAANHLQIYRVTNITRALSELKEQGCWVVGLDAEAKETIYDRDYPQALAVVLGSEGKGMRPLIRRECDFLASIPMLGQVASLNVSVAGAVFLYELARQARAAGRTKSGKNC
ncbi:MAG TPA: 23S rRNA (guanosine(2251)-2'-O)-methyltransferase RlmB [Candidatus Binatia bacterium]